MGNLAGERYTYDYHDGYRKGYSAGQESVREMQDQVLKMFGQINYKYIVVTQEVYDKLKSEGKLL